MKIHNHTRAVLCFVAIAALCLATSGCNAGPNSSSRTIETKRLAEAFILSFNKGDADACIDLLSSDIVVEQKGLQDVKSQDERSVHEALKTNIALRHTWEVIKYLSSTEDSITVQIAERGEDIKLMGMDSVTFEMTIEAKDGKIARIVSVIDKETSEQIAVNTAGGIGVQLEMKPDGIVITGVAANSPAEKAGLKQGYEIAAIDGVRCSDMKQGEHVMRIRGPVGSKVLLQVRRPDSRETYEVELTRVDTSKLSGK